MCPRHNFFKCKESGLDYLCYSADLAAYNISLENTWMSWHNAIFWKDSLIGKHIYDSKIIPDVILAEISANFIFRLRFVVPTNGKSYWKYRYSVFEDIFASYSYFFLI